MEYKLVCVNGNLKEFISKINLKFTYKSITIDFLDYFPLLKDGDAIKSTVYNIVLLYINIFIKYNEFPSSDILFRKTFNKDISDLFWEYKELQIPLQFKNDEYYELINKNVHPLMNLNMTGPLMKEKYLMKELVDTICSWKENSNCTNKDTLLEILISCTSQNLLTILNDTNDYIRLIYAIINKDMKTLIECLYIENIDPRISNNALYKLALCCGKSDIKYLIEKSRESVKSIVNLKNIFEYLEREDLHQYSFVYIMKVKHDMLIKELSEYPNISTEEKNTNLSYFMNLGNFNKTLTLNYCSEMSNIIKEESIRRNWIEKQVLTNNFESLIGISDIPNDIFNYMNNLR